MSINIKTDPLRSAILFGRPVLFASQRIPREEVPESWYYPKKIKRSVPHEHTENRPHPQTGHYDSG